VFRWAGASTLGYLGPDAKAAVPALIQATKDKYGAVSSAAAEALEKIDPEVAKSARENRE